MKTAKVIRVIVINTRNNSSIQLTEQSMQNLGAQKDWP